MYCSQNGKSCGVNYQNDLGKGPAGQMGKCDEKPKERHRDWIGLFPSLSGAFNHNLISRSQCFRTDQYYLFCVHIREGLS